MAIVLWITGLPGSGKSTIASLVKEEIRDMVVLPMDELRKIVTPEPTYSDPERDHAYRSIIYAAYKLYQSGHDVIIDATGNKRSWRRLARELIPHFREVYLTCPVELCMDREKKRIDTHGAPRGIYEKGKAGWPVPGINAPYEEPEAPELVIDTGRESPEEAARKIIALVKGTGR